MRRTVLFLAISTSVFAQEQDVQRALVQRDQQSAEFALRLRAMPLEDLQRMENLSARQQLMVGKDTPQELRPYKRQKAADERTLVLPPPAVRMRAPAKPRPLPMPSPSAVNVVG